MKKYTFYCILLLIGVIFISGCTSSKPYVQPQSANTPSPASYPVVTKTSQAQAPIVKTFNVGESASDGKLRITVNSRKFTNTVGNEYITPKSGNQYLVLDVTVENLQPDKSTAFSSLMQFDAADSYGYAYNEDVMATVSIDKGWRDGSDLLPGGKRRGNVVFEVPLDAKGLQFLFKFDFSGQTAVYNI